jgi:hypothetical protein
MQELLEAIRAATTEDATAEEKTAGAEACRTILTALEATTGKPMLVSGAPPSNPLAGIDLTQALDYLIARLRQAAPADEPTRPGRSSGLRIALVRPPAGEPRRR